MFPEFEWPKTPLAKAMKSAEDKVQPQLLSLTISNWQCTMKENTFKSDHRKALQHEVEATKAETPSLAKRGKLCIDRVNWLLELHQAKARFDKDEKPENLVLYAQAISPLKALLEELGPLYCELEIRWVPQSG